MNSGITFQKKGEIMPWKSLYPIIDGKKICSQCKENKNIEFFGKHKCKQGIRPKCKECLNSRNKQYYIENSSSIKKWAKNYRQTEHRKEWARKNAKKRLKEKRNNSATRPGPLTCECCSDNPDARGIVWDHNHESGNFRGWLCNRCNRVLGMCKDSINVFQNLIKYLENYG
jgi:hypothetical protein